MKKLIILISLLCFTQCENMIRKMIIQIISSTDKMNERIGKELNTKFSHYKLFINRLNPSIISIYNPEIMNDCFNEYLNDILPAYLNDGDYEIHKRLIKLFSLSNKFFVVKALYKTSKNNITFLVIITQSGSDGTDFFL